MKSIDISIHGGHLLLQHAERVKSKAPLPLVVEEEGILFVDLSALR